MARKQIVASVDAAVKDHYQRLADAAGVSLSWYVSGLLVLEYMENGSYVQAAAEVPVDVLAGVRVPNKKWNGRPKSIPGKVDDAPKYGLVAVSLGPNAASAFEIVGTEELKQELLAPPKPSTIQERMAILRSNIQPVEPKPPPANVPYKWVCGCSEPPVKMYGGVGWCTRCRKVYPGVKVKETS